ncbi:MAG TPA: ATP-binding protein [Methanophagales archaeon]|nr:ATP-binding protein [Methanophagales archaeon]
MLQKFVDRARELEFMEKQFKREEAGFIVLYGRRRVGKTELINRFIKDKKHIYFFARRESAVDTFNRLSKELFKVFHDELLISRPFSSMDSFFDYLYEKAKEERFTMVIDEFPMLIERFRGLPSVLQDHWDNKLRFSKLFLILCGSSIGMMETEVLGYRSPLYGRRTGQWKVEPLNFFALAELFPSYSAEGLVKVYSALDTIPGYLVKFDSSLSVEENIEKRIFRKGEFLNLEPEFLLKEELRDPSNYMSILRTIAAVNSAFNEICNSSRLDKSLVSKYLAILENLHIVEKTFSVIATDKARLKGKGSYQIKDKFFNFWFRYVYPFQDYLERGEIAVVADFLSRDFNTYLGFVFEDVAREFLIRMKSESERETPLRMGKWWHRDKEIDLVILNETKKESVFFEVKWRELKRRECEKALEVLKEKSTYVEWHRKDRIVRYGIIAKRMDTDDKRDLRSKGYLVYDLDDFETLMRR